MVHDAGGLLHVDASSRGRIPYNVNEMGAVFYLFLRISSADHGGRRVVRRGRRAAINEPHIKGGGTVERGARAGTRMSRDEQGSGRQARRTRSTWRPMLGRMQRCGERLEAGLAAAAGGSFLGRGRSDFPNTTLFAAPGLRAEVALIKARPRRLGVSSGSACSYG